MILYKEKMVGINQPNVIMLDMPEDHVVYMPVFTFTQIVVLNDRFEGELSLLKKTLGVGDGQEAAVNYFFHNAPSPLNILAPFLGLIDEDVDLKLELRELCGVLHMLSMVINFNEYTMINQNLRSDVSIPKKVVMGYEQAWADVEVKMNLADIDIETISIEALAKVIDKLGLGVRQAAPTQVVTAAPTTRKKETVVVQNYEEEEAEEEMSEEEAKAAKMMALMATMNASIKADIAAMDAEKDKEEEKKKEEPAPAPAHVLSDEEQKKKDERDAIDDLLARMGGAV